MPTSRARLSVIFLTVFIDLVGFGLIMPILPFYAQKFGVAGFGFGALLSIYSLMQFVATQILGRLSDQHGRRPLLLITILFSGAGYVLFALAGSFGMLFFARLISGFSGGNISVAQAYIADVTSPAERSRGMGMIGAAFGLGFVVGPALGGLAGHYLGPTAPAWTAAALCAVNLVSAWFVLPESLHSDHRSTGPFFDIGPLRRAISNPRLAPVIGWWVFAPLAFSGYMVATPLYTSARFGWHEKELGWFFTIVGITAAAVQGYFFGRLTRRFGDRPLLILGTAGMVLGILVVPFAPTAIALYGFTFVLAFANSIAAPAASGLVSRFAGPTEQGTMLGAAQALSALARLLGPVSIGTVYDVWSPRAAYFIAASIMLVACISTTRVPLEKTAGHVAPLPGGS
ncbi:MAG: MFS transporter [Gemmatimonadetes bacterium]|nr:MFS transporter [Gemmatimonadota bacterium]